MEQTNRDALHDFKMAAQEIEEEDLKQAQEDAKWESDNLDLIQSERLDEMDND